MNKQNIEIEDYYGNTLYLISLEIKGNKIKKFKAVNSEGQDLDYADSELIDGVEQIRLQEVNK